MHSASIIIPALLAGAEATQKDRPITGRDLLIAAIAGFETGPRAGLALYGAEMLTRGWHSGPVFGKSLINTPFATMLTIRRLSRGRGCHFSSVWPRRP